MKNKKSAGTFFKQKSYMLAMVLMLAAVFGMTGVYFSEQRQEKKQQQEAELAQREEAQQKLAQQKQKAQEKKKETTKEVDAVIVPENKDFMDSPEVVSTREDTQIYPEAPAEPQEEPDTEETAAPTLPELHFDAAADLAWPLMGNVVMNYSMDQTVYFATLDQYKYNPAIIIQGNVNDKVAAVADGQIAQIATNEETGCTVTVDLGDGYQAVYGQLKEVPLAEGDRIAAGDTIGYISEPTKYYSVEGANLYFQLKKDGESVNPMEYLE